MCAIEWGKCEICGKETQLERTYFHYPIDCTCCGGDHFVIVRHCAECIPKTPNNITLSLKGAGGLPLNVRICGLMPWKIEGKFDAVEPVGIPKEKVPTEEADYIIKSLGVDDTGTEIGFSKHRLGTPSTNSEEPAGKSDIIDWGQRRYEIARACLAGYNGNSVFEAWGNTHEEKAKWAVADADALIQELKKHGAE